MHEVLSFYPYNGKYPSALDSKKLFETYTIIRFQFRIYRILSGRLNSHNLIQSLFCIPAIANFASGREKPPEILSFNYWVTPFTYPKTKEKFLFNECTVLIDSFQPFIHIHFVRYSLIGLTGIRIIDYRCIA